MISFENLNFITLSTVLTHKRITSTNILRNIGLIFFIIIFVAMFSALLIGFRFLFKRSETVRKIVDSISRKIFFNAFLRALMKGYLNFAIAMFISMQSV